MKQFLTIGMFALVGAGLASAQRNAVVITPRITGGDSAAGKCIVRIMVDDTVNVRIGNGQIRVLTIQGQDSRNDGTECSSLLRNGRNLTDFKFKGIDGRGEVRLQSDPRQDPNGEAVVYIRDAKGGDEGYTFEVSWQGDNGMNNSGNSNNGGFFGGNRGNNNNNNNNNNNGNFGTSGNSYDRAMNTCMDRVRQEVQRDFNVSNLTFDNMNTNNSNNNNRNNNNRNNSRIVGTVRGDNGDRFRYTCQVNANNGNVRSVNVRRN